MCKTRTGSLMASGGGVSERVCSGTVMPHTTNTLASPLGLGIFGPARFRGVRYSPKPRRTLQVSVLREFPRPPLGVSQRHPGSFRRGIEPYPPAATRSLTASPWPSSASPSIYDALQLTCAGTTSPRTSLRQLPLGPPARSAQHRAGDNWPRPPLPGQSGTQAAD